MEGVEGGHTIVGGAVEPRTWIIYSLIVDFFHDLFMVSYCFAAYGAAHA